MKHIQIIIEFPDEYDDICPELCVEDLRMETGDGVSIVDYKEIIA